MNDSRCAAPYQSRMRSGIHYGGAAALALVSACATTPDDAASGFSPPPVGTEIEWRFNYSNGVSEVATSRLVATGDDFAIFLADTGLAGDEPNHYFAEFAGGVFFLPCGDPMPTAAQREAALGVWPLSTGDTADVVGEIAIGQQDRVTVNGDFVDVVWSDYTYSLEGKTYTDSAAVAIDIGTAVRVRYDDGTVGVVREYRPGDGKVNEVLDRKPEILGNCASLLQ